MEPTDQLEDDLNVTDMWMPGNPTHSYRSTAPVRVVRELEDWPQHSEESVRARREGLESLRRDGRDEIIELAIEKEQKL